jgi:hypothetical protein
MLAVGLELAASTAKRVGPPATPENFRGEPTASEGEARLRWKRPLRRCTFELAWETGPADPASLTLRTTTSRQSHRVAGLESGGKYWFYVRARNANGHSPWSQPMVVRVK